MILLLLAAMASAACPTGVQCFYDVGEGYPSSTKVCLINDGSDEQIVKVNTLNLTGSSITVDTDTIDVYWSNGDEDRDKAIDPDIPANDDVQATLQRSSGNRDPIVSGDTITVKGLDGLLEIWTLELEYVACIAGQADPK
jgi:hypothetical protein